MVGWVGDVEGLAWGAVRGGRVRKGVGWTGRLGAAGEWRVRNRDRGIHGKSYIRWRLPQTTKVQLEMCSDGSEDALDPVPSPLGPTRREALACLT